MRSIEGVVMSKEKCIRRGAMSVALSCMLVFGGVPAPALAETLGAAASGQETVAVVDEQSVEAQGGVPAGDQAAQDAVPNQVGSVNEQADETDFVTDSGSASNEEGADSELATGGQEATQEDASDDPSSSADLQGGTLETSGDADDESAEQVVASEDVIASTSDDAILQGQENEEPTKVVVTATGDSATAGRLTVSDLTAGAVRYRYDVSEGYANSGYIQFSVTGDTSNGKATITSSNTSVVEVYEGHREHYGSTMESMYVYLESHTTGGATITVTYTEGEQTYAVKFAVLVYPTSETLVSVKKANYRQVKLAWKKTVYASGYYVQRAPTNEWGYVSDTNAWKTVKKVTGTTAVVNAPWEKSYAYRLIPYVSYGGKTASDSNGYNSNSITFALPKPAVILKSVTKAGASSLKLAWKAGAGATSYIVYRSINENYGYKKIKTTKGTTYTNKVSKGVTYYYKIVAVYGTTGKVTSNTMGQMISKSTKTKGVTIAKTSGLRAGGQYEWNWAQPDSIYTYRQGSNVYTVSRSGRYLLVVGLNSAMKQVSTRKVKLPSYELWGGMYHGPDGNNYVAIGYNNHKESKTKVVIKILKYSNNWKLAKVASIKGGASNSFEGIYQPFDASGGAFDMQGSTLFFTTGRTMFQTSDGLHHQSNISFAINTKTMKAYESNVTYASHSFNQRARFKDGALYVMNHGDAYPRSMYLSISNNYGRKDETSVSTNAFVFQGTLGDNYTGAALGGLEVGTKNVISCGISVPQGYKVSGVSGSGNKYKLNVYLTISNRKTGKTVIRWITNYHPTKSTTSVSEARMVKITDDRFGILYSTVKNGKETVHYVLVNNVGKKLSSRIIKNVRFTGCSQPVVSGGCVWWTDVNTKGKAVVYRTVAF